MVLLDQTVISLDGDLIDDVQVLIEPDYRCPVFVGWSLAGLVIRPSAEYNWVLIWEV